MARECQPLAYNVLSACVFRKALRVLATHVDRALRIVVLKSRFCFICFTRFLLRLESVCFVLVASASAVMHRLLSEPSASTAGRTAENTAHAPAALFSDPRCLDVQIKLTSGSSPSAWSNRRS